MRRPPMRMNGLFPVSFDAGGREASRPAEWRSHATRTVPPTLDDVVLDR